MLTYKSPKQLSRKTALKIFAHGKKNNIIEALIAVAFYEKDWQWSQEQFLHFLHHSDYEIRATAAVCLGHSSRIHKKIYPQAITALKSMLNDATISGSVHDALDDIELFIT